MSGSLRGTVYTTRTNVFIGFRKARVDGAPLFRRVFIIVGRRFRRNRNNAARCTEFQLLTTLEPSRAANCLGDHKRRFIVIFYGNGHGT